MNEKINIQEFIQLLSEKHDISIQDAETFIKEFFLLIESGLERDKYVKVKGLGTFKLIDVDNRESVDVNTGERIEILGHTKVSFTPENALKEMVNRPFSHFEAVVLNENVTFDDLQGEAAPAGEEKEEEGELDTDSQVDSEKQAGILPEGILREEEVGNQPDNFSEVVPNEEWKAVQKEKPSMKPEESGEDNSAEKSEMSVEKSERLAAKTEEFAENTVPAKTDRKERMQPEEQDSECPEKVSVPEDGKGKTTVFLWIVGLVMLMCACVVAALYWNTVFPNEERPDMPAITPDYATEQLVADTVDKTPASADTCIQNCDKHLPDSVYIKQPPSPVDAVTEGGRVSESRRKVSKTKESSARPLIIDSVSYTIVGTQASYTIKEGETLTKVALRFYGTKALWPYIVKHNQAVIKNPDNVPYGTVIRIPKLKKKL